MADTLPLDQITHDTFAGMENESFDFHLGGDEPVKGTLVSVKHGGPRVAPGVTRVPFALLFRLPKDVARGFGTYPVEHSKLGKVALHMTAMLPDEDSSYFEVVFN